MEGCSSCLSSFECMSCEAGLTLTLDNLCSKVVTTPKYISNDKISLKTRYKDEQTLVHDFIVVAYEFNKEIDLSAVNWGQ